MDVKHLVPGLLMLGLLAISLNNIGKSSDITLNCTAGNCNSVRLDKRPLSCNNWDPKQPRNKLKCNYTQNGLENVGLITDHGNYILGDWADTRYRVETYDVFQWPSDIDFSSSGSIYTSDYLGNLTVSDQNMNKKYSIDIENYLKGPEPFQFTGEKIKRIALHPDFNENRYIYIYYQRYDYNASQNNGWNAWSRNDSFWMMKVSRFELRDRKLKNEKVLLKINGGQMHSGGGFEFGPDRKLYISIGDGGTYDAGARYNGTDMSSARGKILRLNPDGSIPKDNPFRDSFVYSYGHRNPQSLGWDPETGELYSSEHGPHRYDEINTIQPGRHYGWPTKLCSTDTPFVEGNLSSYETPVRCFKNWTMAPSSMTFVHDQSSPWYGDMFVTGLRGKHLRRFETDKGKIISEELFYTHRGNYSQRLRDVEYFNGSLWIIGEEEGLYKLTPEG